MAILTSNTTAANGTEAVMTLLTTLTASGWTVVAWSDATTLTTPGSPLTSNPYGGSGSGPGNLGNTSAWFRILAPASYEEWIFFRGSSDVTWTVVRSRTAFSVGGAATTRSTSTIEDILVSAATFFPATSFTWNISVEDASPYGFTAFHVVSGGGNVKTLIFSEPLAAGTYSPLDQDPVVYGAAYDATGYGPYDLVADNSTQIRYWRKRVRHGMTSPSPSTTWAGLQHIRSDSVGASMAPATNTGTGQIGVEPYGSKEIPLPIAVGWAQASYSGGWQGYLSRQRWCTVGGRVNGQTLYDSASVKYFIYMIGIWVPWDSSIPAI